MIEITIDLETTANGGHKGSPEAHYANNKVLWYGWKDGHSIYTSKTGVLFYDRIEDLLSCDIDIRLIGHNLKFDLKYLIRERPDIAWHKIDYYCTMYGEYRQSGHKYKFSSLENTCDRHGLPFTKGLDLGAILKSGLKMEDIPDSDLEPYLRGDVEATAELYHSHIMHPSYDEYMHQHVLPLANMELLGLPLDVKLAQSEMIGLVKDERVFEADLFKFTKDKLEWSDGVPLKESDLKFTAPRTVSYLLTGEPAKGLTTAVRRNIVWKTGCGPMLTPTEILSVWGNEKPTNLGYKMPKSHLDELIKIPTAASYMAALIDYRRVSKMIGTYFGPFLEEAKIQPTIHPKMNMAQTSTGRLSSSQPNGQNLPPEARQLFKSEYGQFHEIDFTQLEVVALAYLSKDIQLIQDIRNGEDIHFNTGQHVMGWMAPNDMKKKDRTLVKNVVFGLIYGGGATGLSHTTGQPVKLIKQLIKAFYSRYPSVADWQKEFYTDMTNLLKPLHLEKGEMIYDALVKDQTSGRKFYFKEGLAPKWVKAKTGRSFSFKPTESKNYPVQGFAGGDIVMMALWELYYRLCDIPDTEIRMTVHDSILVDTSMNSRMLDKIMRDVCDDLVKYWHLPFNLSFDITSGQYWQ